MPETVQWDPCSAVYAPCRGASSSGPPPLGPNASEPWSGASGAAAGSGDPPHAPAQPGSPTDTGQPHCQAQGGQEQRVPTTTSAQRRLMTVLDEDCPHPWRTGTRARAPLTHGAGCCLVAWSCVRAWLGPPAGARAVGGSATRRQLRRSSRARGVGPPERARRGMQHSAAAEARSARARLLRGMRERNN